jgi:uncharacterized protein (TIGR03437 family)
MTIKTRNIFWGAAGTCVALFPAFLMGHYDGPDSGHAGAPGTDNPLSCAAAGLCHNGNGGDGVINKFGGSVTATFSSGTTYIPGGSPITISVTASDPVNKHFGFQMTARVSSTASGKDPQQAGSFNPGPKPGTSANPLIVLCSDNNLRVGSCSANSPYEYIEHFFNNYQAVYTTSQSYTFTWTPPATNVGNVSFYVAGNVVNYTGQPDSGDHVYTASYTLTPGTNNPPSIVTGGVLNAASFAKGSDGLGTPVAPGSLVSIFATNFGTAQAGFSTIPFPTILGGVTAAFGGTPAPMRDVVPAAGLINVQIPFATKTGSTNAVIATSGGASPAQAVTIVAQAPGLFTIPPGLGNAILVNLTDDPKGTIGNVAGPSSANIGLKTSPIKRGNFAFFYATGLGVMTPPVPDGDGGSDGKEHDAVMPQVTIGGMPALVLFAGQAPGFPGVYQVNIQIPQSAPTGDNIDMRIISADGSQKSPAGVATISVQ